MNRLDFARKTLRLRHGIVKLITPRLYYDTLQALAITSAVTAIPRPMILFLKEHLDDGELVGAEIGVAAGDNAQSILELLPMKKLFLIDPYTSFVENGGLVSFEKDYQTAKARLSKFEQATWIMETSEVAINDIDEPLDFVYIDGNHSYEYVKQDIANYYPLVKQGGVIGGHDYTPFHHPGVLKAVNEFVKEKGRLDFHAVFPDWWVVKR